MKSQLIVALASFFLAAAVSSQAADAPKAADTSVLRQLDMKVDVGRIKNLGDSQTIVVPTVYVKMMVAGKLMAVKQTSGLSLLGGGNGNTVRASAHYSVAGLDKAFAQKLAAKVYDDLVAKLRDAGYTVKTYADIKDLDAVKKIERSKTDEAWGLPLEKNQMGSDVMIVATPSDEQNFKPGVGGAVISPFQHFGKSSLGDGSGTLLIPVFTFSAPQVWAKTDEGYSSISAEVNVAPGMNMMGALAPFLTAGGAWGDIKTKGYSPNISSKVGELAKQDVTDTAGNSFSKAMGMLSGAGSISTSKGIYVLTIDPAAYEAGLMNGAGAFNAEIAKAAKGVRK